MKFQVHLHLNDGSLDSRYTESLRGFKEAVESWPKNHGNKADNDANVEMDDDTLQIFLLEADAPIQELDGEEPTNIVQKLFQKSDRGLTFLEDQKGVVLLLSRGWKDKKSELHDAYRENQFYLDTLASYGLGRLVDIGSDWLKKNEPGVGEAGYQNWEDEKNWPSDFKDALIRIIVSPEDALDIFTRINQMDDDLMRIYGVVKKYLPESNLDERNDAYVFMQHMAALFPLGRLGNDKAEKIVNKKVGWMSIKKYKKDEKDEGEKFGGSYQISDAIDQIIRDRHQSHVANEEDRAKRAERLLELESMLARYEITRDMARCVSAGAPYWASVNSESGLLNIVLIDELFAPQKVGETDHIDSRKEWIREALREVQTVLRDRVQFYAYETADWDEVKPALVRAVKSGRKLTVHNLDNQKRELEYSEIHVLLTEIEFKKQVVGPQIVRWLEQFFVREAKGKHRPRVMVFSRLEHMGHVHQCLASGAEAYVLKHRVHALAARLAKVQHPLPIDPDGLKSNFLALYEMLPQKILALQGTQGRTMILGAANRAKEKEWLQLLPKADLHFHIGTTIGLDCIEVLAFNTVGYLVERVGSPNARDTNGKRFSEAMDSLVRKVWKLVLRIGTKWDPYAKDPLEKLVGELGKEIKDDLDFREELATNKVFDQIVSALSPADKQTPAHQACAIFVCIICLAWRRKKAGSRLAWKESARESFEKWTYFKKLDELVINVGALQDQEFVDDDKAKISEWIQRHSQSSLGLMHSLRGTQIIDEGKQLTWDQFGEAAKVRSEEALEYLLDIYEGIENLAEDEDKNYWEGLKLTPGNIGENQPSLADLVQIPDRSPERHNLLRYLAGAGLLGAEHLQYPENIVLAAQDLVEQSIQERIIYSEVRCETTGYTQAGMSAPGATDLLCRAFDLAVLKRVYGDESEQVVKKNWVRINVLLGAKRHKSAHACQEIVSLLTYYLQKDYVPRKDDAKVFPSWWRPSAVVGFDLSGDETKSEDQFEKIMEPLYTYCSPITIHAGEAAKAEKIWTAVHQFGARRIGHGLRLGENPRLLSYCVSAGLCMELCPTSNKFTNYFNQRRPRIGDSELRASDLRGPNLMSEYPLLYFMAAGLDVCLNTDNRQLHAQGDLSDEYLCAAQLSGGLTRWEVLKLIRSSFKKAFLPKDQIVEIMRYVESELFEKSDAELELVW